MDRPLEEASKGGRQRHAAGDLLAFVLVGGTAAICFVGLSSALIALRTGVPDWLLSAGCYGAMIVPVYLAHRRLSFRSATRHRVALPRYVAVQAAALTLAALLSYLAYDVLRLPTLPAAALVIVLTSLLSFLLLRLWAFAEDRRQ